MGRSLWHDAPTLLAHLLHIEQLRRFDITFKRCRFDCLAYALAHDLGGFAIDFSQEIAEELIESFGGPIPAAQAYYEQLCRLADFEEISIVGHFDLLTKYDERKPLYPTASKEYRDAAFAAMETLHAAGKIFEINTGAISRGWRTTPYPAPELLRHLRAIGGRICVCSDAHAADGIVCGFEAAEALARSCGFTEYQVFDGKGFVPAAF